MITSKHVIGICAAVATAALIVVGLVSGEIARHVLQTLPLWPAAALGLADSPKAKWAGAPVFLFWLLIMLLIWAYLLHISDIASGTYSFAEKAMTVVVVVAATAGLGACGAVRGITLWSVGWSALLFVAQIGAMMISLNTPFENDAMFLKWITG